MVNQNKSLDVIAKDLQDRSAVIYKDDASKKRFFDYAISIYTQKPELRTKLDNSKIDTAILQMFLRGADAVSGEAYIVPRRVRGQWVAQVQNGYKFAMRKLWETGELKSKPIVFELRHGEVVAHDAQTRDIEYNKPAITSEEEFNKRKNTKIAGWVARFEMTNGDIIEKFWWAGELDQYLLKYSDAYRSYLKNKTGVFATNMYEMQKKTIFKMAWREYLPKTAKLNQAYKDVNALDNATYKEFKLGAKPYYYDNPTSEEFENIKNPKLVAHDPKPEPEVRNLTPLEKPASKEAILELFRFMRERLPGREGKIQKKIKDVIEKMSKARDLPCESWFDTSWIVLEAICTKINNQLKNKGEPEFNFNIKPPKESE